MRHRQAHVGEAARNPATHDGYVTGNGQARDGSAGTGVLERAAQFYVSNDFGVLRLGADETAFTAAAPGLPTVEVAGLTVVPGERILDAATHGLGAWRLNLG